DVVRSDKQDDNAAARLFSASALECAAQLPEDNLGLCVYLFVFGEFIDAFQSRSMPHRQRARIAIRTRIFLSTWKSFLKKQGYAENRHYISKQADDIFHILIDGLLGLLLIHRDHLPKGVPLLLWKHATMGNENIFSVMCGITPDFSLVQAILMAPHLRVSMLASMRARFAKAGFKEVASGYQFADDGSVDYKLLAEFPSDADLSAEMGCAIEENEALWALVGVRMQIL
ncbi:hypothetical protein BDZ89DRAFT_920748, partial [Hymenopellis radicata]